MAPDRRRYGHHWEVTVAEETEKEVIVAAVEEVAVEVVEVVRPGMVQVGCSGSAASRG